MFLWLISFFKSPYVRQSQETRFWSCKGFCSFSVGIWINPLRNYMIHQVSSSDFDRWVPLLTCDEPSLHGNNHIWCSQPQILWFVIQILALTLRDKNTIRQQNIVAVSSFSCEVIWLRQVFDNTSVEIYFRTVQIGLTSIIFGILVGRTWCHGCWG